MTAANTPIDNLKFTIANKKPAFKPAQSLEELFTGVPGQKAYYKMQEAAANLSYQIQTLDNYVGVLLEQAMALESKGYSATREKLIIGTKIGILETLKADIENAVQKLNSNFADNTSITNPSITFTSNDKDFLNDPRHGKFANFCGDVVRALYALVGGIVALTIMVGTFPAGFGGMVASESMASIFSLGVTSYHAKRMGTYGQYFSSGKTSSCQIAEKALKSLNEVTERIQDFNSIPSL